MDALLARVGGSLEYLEVGSYGSALDAHVAETILMRCPRLVTLSIPNASTEFFRRLAAAYDDGTCSIPKLWVWTVWPDTAGVVLLEALQDPTSGATRSVRELVLNTAMEIVEEDVVPNTAIATISTNTALARVALRGAFRPEAIARIEGLPQRFVVRVPSLRRRLAFISVLGRRRLPKLPPDVLEVVFSLAGRRVLRVEH